MFVMVGHMPVAVARVRPTARSACGAWRSKKALGAAQRLLHAIVALLFAAGLLGPSGLAAGPVLTELGDSAPPGDIRWRANFRVGDAPATSSDELLLGDPGNLPFPARADFPWTPGVAEAFEVSFDGSNLLQMSLGGTSVSLAMDSVSPPILADSTELLLRILANSQTTTGEGPPVEFVEVVVSDLMLEGMPVGAGLAALNTDPCDGVSAGPFSGTACDADSAFLRIGGPDLTDGFVLTGAVELDWGDGEMPLFSRLRFGVDGLVPEEPLTPGSPRTIAEPSSAALLAVAWAGMLVVAGRRARQGCN